MKKALNMALFLSFMITIFLAIHIFVFHKKCMPSK